MEKLYVELFDPEGFSLEEMEEKLMHLESGRALYLRGLEQKN